MSNLVEGRTGEWEVVIGLEVHAQVSSSAKLFSGAPTAFGADPNANVSLVDAAMPGMLSAECVEADGHTYLAIEVAGDPADPRADDIIGDVVVGGEVLADWGLHLIDMNVAMGNLIDIVKAQADTWVAEQAGD